MNRIVVRNLKLYFRDKTSVFFSLLAVLIVIALYILFLAQLQIDTVTEATNGVLEEDKISYLINSWILAGLLSITTVTSTLGAYGSMVDDREKRKNMDFKSSPLSPWEYPIAQLISAFIIGAVISIIAFITYAIYIYISTGYAFFIEQIIKCILLILISTLMSAGFMGFIVAMLKTNSSFASISFVIGTVIGFLNGLYVPLGALPTAVQTAVKCLPFGHVASLFRLVLTSGSVSVTFDGMPKSVLDSYLEMYGINLKWSGADIPVGISMAYIAFAAIVTLFLFFVIYNKKRNEI